MHFQSYLEKLKFFEVPINEELLKRRRAGYEKRTCQGGIFPQSLNVCRGGLLFCIALLFSGCENFLEGASIKRQIEEEIDYAKAPSYEIRVECDGGAGEITTEKRLSKKVRDEFTVEFEAASDDVQVAGWRAYLQNGDGTFSELTNEYVLFFSYNTGNTDGIYRTNVRFQKAAEGTILIRPYCIFPTFFPPYNPAGYNQDTGIKITFNVPVNPESFGDFSCIGFYDSSNNNLRDRFGTPYFSDGNKVLNIPTSKSKLIIEDGSGVEYTDVTIAADFTGVTDSEGTRLIYNKNYTYRVNKNVDNVPPVLTEAKVFSTSDTTSNLYKELTGRDFASWSDTETENYRYGDFSQNHVGGKIYFELTGSDAGGGIGSVQVRETYFRSVTGEETTDTAHTYQVPCEESDGVYSAEYQIRSSIDGVIRLDFTLVDYSGNVSEAKTFYVIKDTSIDPKAVMFEENLDMNQTGLWKKEMPYYGIRKVNGNVDTVTLTAKSTTVDKFYSSYTEPFDIDVLWGYSEDTITNSAVKTTNSSGAAVCTFDRDYTKLTYVKTTFADQSGNSKINIRAIPPILDFDMNCVTTNKDKPTAIENKISINPYDIQGVQSVCNKVGAKKWSMYYAHMPYWFEHEKNVCHSKELMDICFYKYQTDKFKGFSTTIHLIGAFEYADGSFWTAPLSITGLKCDFADDYDDTFDKITMSIDGKPTTTAGDSSYIKDYIQVNAVGIKNSVNYKITLDDYKTEKGKTTEGVKFMFKCQNIDTNENFLSSAPEFYLPSNATYRIYIISEDSNGKKYTSSYRDFYLNGSTGSSGILVLTEDLTPPKIPSELENKFDIYNYDGYKLWYNSTPNSFTPHWFKSDEWSFAIPIQIAQAYVPTDNIEMFANSDGLGEIEYFFIPNYGSSVTNFGIFSEEEFEAHQKKTATYDLNQMNYTLPQWQNRTTNSVTGTDESGFRDSYRQMRIEIPYDGLEEGFYTLCMKAKDAAGNYSYAFAPAVNRTLGKHLDWTFDSSNNTMTFNDDTTPYYGAMLYYYDSAHNRWVSFYGRLDSTDVNLLDRYFCMYLGKISEAGFFKNRWARIIAVNKTSSSLEAGFYDVEYVYLDYHRYKDTSSAIVCKNRNLVDGVGGVQVFCDKPILAHTMYCSKRLTQNNTKADAVVWENKGIETGLVFESSNFTYGAENYDEIPAGCYYTTIIHFADGTTLMSEVKQK